jgi:hypothetical protein
LTNNEAVSNNTNNMAETFFNDVNIEFFKPNTQKRLFEYTVSHGLGYALLASIGEKYQ